MTSPRYKWTREEIRAARRAHLPSVLRAEGFKLRETREENFELLQCPGLIVKDNYWRWPDQNRQGNSIDLLVTVLGVTFHGSTVVPPVCRPD